MSLFGGCGGSDSWIWILIIIVLVLCCCGDGNGIFGGNNDCCC